jgi:hypothetical protein
LPAVMGPPRSLTKNRRPRAHSRAIPAAALRSGIRGSTNHFCKPRLRRVRVGRRWLIRSDRSVSVRSLLAKLSGPMVGRDVLSGAALPHYGQCQLWGIPAPGADRLLMARPRSSRRIEVTARRNTPQPRARTSLFRRAPRKRDQSPSPDRLRPVLSLAKRPLRPRRLSTRPCAHLDCRKQSTR